MKKPFILKYDNFGKMLIEKSNAIFKDTSAEIKDCVKGQTIKKMNIFKRLALITTCFNEDIKTLPITPLQSELFLKEKKLPYSGKYSESLALFLSGKGNRYFPDLYSSYLYEEILKNFPKLKNIPSVENKAFLIVNPGLKRTDITYTEKDKQSSIIRIIPTILPKFTEVYPYFKVLSFAEKAHMGGYECTAIGGGYGYYLKFYFGSKGGLPDINDLVKVKFQKCKDELSKALRPILGELFIPKEEKKPSRFLIFGARFKEDINYGLRYLVREESLNLALDGGSGSEEIVTFVENE